MTTTKQYGICQACGDLLYREPGKRHGDGQVDSDIHPVWLLSAQAGEDLSGKIDGLIAEGHEVPTVNCGCCDHA